MVNNLIQYFQVVFTISFAWVQLTVVTPLLLQLVTTTTLAHFYATMIGNLESSGCGFQDNAIALQSINRESTSNSTSTKIHQNQSYRRRPKIMSTKAVRQIVQEHQHLAALCDSLSEALGPLLVLAHLYLVYSIILAIFTVVFNYKV